MATKIVKCPSCTKDATWHPIGGVQCVRCGYREGLTKSEVRSAEMARIASTIPAQEPRQSFGLNKADIEDLDIVTVHVEPGKQINLF